MEYRENEFNYEDIHVTLKGEVLKFVICTISHNEIFYIATREWLKEYDKNWA